MYKQNNTHRMLNNDLTCAYRKTCILHQHKQHAHLYCWQCGLLVLQREKADFKERKTETQTHPYRDSTITMTTEQTCQPVDPYLACLRLLAETLNHHAVSLQICHECFVLLQQGLSKKKKKKKINKKKNKQKKNKKKTKKLPHC